jgi:spermidine synthase
MLPWITVATARIDKSELVLARHGDDWVVRVGSRVLMTNRVHESEEALAEEALDRRVREGEDEPARVLVGGLGLGYTLRAVLDAVGPDTSVTVAELVPDLVAWNRTHLAELNDHPLDDPRCEVVVGDVLDVIKRSPRTFDVILLDVDNGPEAISQAKNERLYGDAGVRACHAALVKGGVLAVWSAGPNARYERRLASHGFDVDIVRARARTGSRVRHVLFLGLRVKGP